MKRTILRVLLAAIALIALSANCNAEGSKETISRIHKSFLIGEMLPSGNVYLEWLALDGGFDNFQKFDGSRYPKKLKVFPLVGANNTQYQAVLKRIVRNKYIGDLEKSSRYFSYPFSEFKQDALLYMTSYKPKSAMLIISHKDGAIESVSIFSKKVKREFTEKEKKDAMKQVATDNKYKKENGSTLAEITAENTILGANKMALIQLKGTGYNILLSKYRTWGMEYASNVYVSDFIKDGKVVETMEKNNTDGPY